MAKQKKNEPCCSNSGTTVSSCCPGDTSVPLVTIGGFASENLSETVPQVETKLTLSDKIGSWKARWGINRNNFKVTPGIYKVGEADKSSPVLVTANYKMSFDSLRKELEGIDAWILVLDTKGINVWCAAGKGTFGTDELIKRILLVNLSQKVSHKTIILPQLGAPGIAAHEVQKKSGFKVVYGPVRAADLKEFLNNGMKATSAMRKVRFSFYDRLVLTPIELVGTLKKFLMVFGVLFILNVLGIGSFGVVDLYGYIGALVVGAVLVPVLLPWIPGKAFAWKGWLLGLLWAMSVNYLNGWPYDPQFSLLRALGYLLVLPAVSSYYAMNFTGASTYTSPSGVLKEMRLAVPLMFISIVLGFLLIIIGSF